jgi:hypothetical protein
MRCSGEWTRWWRFLYGLRGSGVDGQQAMVGVPLMAAGRYREGNRRRWAPVSMKGRRQGGEPVGYPPPKGGEEVRRRQLDGVHGDGASESWRKGTRWGCARWAAAFSWAKKAGGSE